MQRRLMLFAITVLVLTTASVVWYAYKSSGQSEGMLTVQDGNLFRILDDPLPNRYWILNREHGLVLLTENPPGQWTTQAFNFGDVRDATGPDSNGLIYCSFGGNPAGVYLFDTSTCAVVRTIPLDRYPRCLVLSPDEAKLYVCVYQWPLLGVLGDHADRDHTIDHRDGGRLLEVDMATGEILREATVGTLPRTILYFESDYGDHILVGTEETFWVDDPGSGIALGDITKVDNVPLDRFTRMEPRIECMYPFSDFTNDFFEWPGDDTVAGQCHIRVEPIYGYDNMLDAIWLIDPITNAVADTIRVSTPDDGVAGAKHALVSECNPDEIFISGGDRTWGLTDTVLVADRWNGTILRSFSTAPYITDFLHETPTGNLIVTCGGSGKIFIIDPSS